MTPCGILLMALINQEKSIIQGIDLPSYYRLDFIRMICKKSHDQAENLSSYHETGNIVDFPTNRRIPEKICPPTPILQGGIAFFAVFQVVFRFFRKPARIENKSVTLPDLRRDSGFSKISFILKTNLPSFHGMIRDRRILGKSHDLSCGLMSSSCVGFIYYILKKIDYSMFQINVH